MGCRRDQPIPVFNGQWLEPDPVTFEDDGFRGNHLTNLSKKED